MYGMLQIVSTLLMTVGEAYRPATAGNGGLSRGWPRYPSRLSRSAVSSPQMYAPAPACTTTSMSKPLPSTLVPMKPAALACSTAAATLRIAFGTSPRM